MFGISDEKLPEVITLTTDDVVGLYNGRIASIGPLRSAIEGAIETLASEAQIERARSVLKGLAMEERETIFLRDHVAQRDEWVVSHDVAVRLIHKLAPFDDLTVAANLKAIRDADRQKEKERIGSLREAASQIAAGAGIAE